jgi:hypothetical protein
MVLSDFDIFEVTFNDVYVIAKHFLIAYWKIGVAER